MFIEHIFVIIVMMLFWDKWSNTEKTRYQEFEFIGSARRGLTFFLSMESSWRGNGPQFIRSHCPPALSRTQCWIPESHSWKWMPEGQLSMQRWPLYEPSMVTWGFLFTHPTSPQSLMEAENHWPGTQRASLTSSSAGPAQSLVEREGLGLGRSYYSPSSSGVRGFRVPEIGWFPQ